MQEECQENTYTHQPEQACQQQVLARCSSAVRDVLVSVLQCLTVEWKVQSCLELFETRYGRQFGIYVGHKAWICAICGLPCAKRGSMLCNRARMMRGRGRCLPLCQRGSNVVLDFEAKDGTKSMNSKPTLLEDQRKEHEAIVMDEREAFYHATS